MRWCSDFDEAIRQSLRIALCDGDEHVDHPAPHFGREATDLAEIDDGKRTVLLDQQIARMRVRVKHAALERGFQHEPGDTARDRCSMRLWELGNRRPVSSFDTARDCASAP